MDEVLPKDEPISDQQQQQQQQSEASNFEHGKLAPTNTSVTESNKEQTDFLFSNKRWGTTPIRQDTPWELPPSPSDNAPTQQHQHQHQPQQQQPPPPQPQQPQPIANEFARAPGPASSILDSNSMTPKPSFGLNQRASTWSSFGASTGPNDSDSDWPKTTTAGISAGSNPSQPPSNAFDLVHEFEPGKSWHGSNLMKSLYDDSPMSIGSASAFPGAYAFASKSPTGSQYEPSGIGTWSPIVKGARPGSMWDGDGFDGGRGDNGRFDDGTAIWGSSVQTKVAGIDWDKSGDANGNNDKSRSSAMAGNNQSAYRPQQSSSSTSLLMSSNTSPSSQQNRNQALKQPSLSHSFDQVQQQSNASSSQANQPNRGLGLSSNVPSKHQQQLTTMVQQIQLAVQAGHLNPQILNQPLAPVTLQLLYQLLQQIRSLHQLQMKFNQPGNHQAAVSVQMTKTKQNILNLQNQIAAQQAMHLKQQTQAHNISARQSTMPNLATGGLGGGIGPALPPGISQSGDSFRSGTSMGDFHGQAIVNNFGVDSMSVNGLASSLNHMNLGGAGVLGSSRFDHPWRAPASKPHQTSMASSFANHNLMNAAPGGMQKTMLNSVGGNGGGSSYVGMQQSGDFARAPGPASSMMDNNIVPKPFGGVANRSNSTWSAFGNSGSNDPESEWPKSATSSSGISSGATPQPSNAFDLVPEFEPGKPWRGSMLMRSVEDDPTLTPGSMARSIAPQRKTIWSDEIL